MHAQPRSFKFTFVRGGQAASVFAKDGMVVPEGLVLDGMQLAMPSVADTDTRGKRLIVTLHGGHYLDPTLLQYVEDDVLVLEVRKPSAREIEVAVDVFASHVEAQGRYAMLQSQGRAELFRSVPCGFCGATIDLSELPQSEYVYCRFCATIHHHSGHIGHSDDYRTCDECNMFGRNQAYTEFYFYFLVVFYGASYTQRNMCDNCAQQLFWKVFLMNFLFILGVPTALWLRLKSSIGRDDALARLPKANNLALGGQTQAARAEFAAMLTTFPNHPGLMTNEAWGHIETGDVGTAHQMLQAALVACPNYEPAQNLMHALST